MEFGLVCDWCGRFRFRVRFGILEEMTAHCLSFFWGLCIECKVSVVMRHGVY